jgi:hypothetical protein
MDITNSQVILRPLTQSQVVPSGPGRLLTEAYLAGDRYCERKFGRLAHKWGLGPDAVAKQIWEQIEKDGILLDLTDLDQDVAHELEGKCQALMKYALPYIFLFSISAMTLILFPGRRNLLLN